MRIVISTCLALLLAACGGELDLNRDLTSDRDDVVKAETYAAKVYQIANAVILDSRPRATRLLTTQLNIVLANNNILGTTIKADEVESEVLSPLSSGPPPKTCPYLTQQQPGSTLTCRYLVDRAVEASLLESTALQDSIEQDVGSKHGKTLTVAELTYVNQWAGEAVLSGIDVGAAHTVKMLRERKACDQAPDHAASARKLGEKQGAALLEQTEKAVLPTIPKSQCNTDIIAATVKAQATKKITPFMNDNALCAGYSAADLAEAVDLAQAEQSRRKGIEAGIRQAYEALRVRLVSSWKCTPCKCYIRHSGKGPTQCFRTSSTAHPAQLLNQGVPLVPQSDCSSTPVPVGSPLVVDLDGDGINLSNRHRIPFDLAATGEPVKIPALRGRDALLALDRDGNGRIDSGAELFGNAAPCGSARCTDGVEALARHDANGDGRIDARDPVFARLRLWRDANRDGRSQPAELSGLSGVGLRSISLSARLDASWADAAGNSVTRALSFTRTDGSTGLVPDVWFSLAFDRLPTDPRTSGITSTLRPRR